MMGRPVKEIAGPIDSGGLAEEKPKQERDQAVRLPDCGIAWCVGRILNAAVFNVC